MKVINIDVDCVCNGTTFNFENQCSNFNILLVNRGGWTDSSRSARYAYMITKDGSISALEKSWPNKDYNALCRM